MAATTNIIAVGSRRRVYLRDGLVILVLCLVTVALFAVTLFLFKSFQRHREDLGRRWSARGRQALARRQPEEAAADLRIALSYMPDDAADQLSLAQALEGAGHLEAANSYFLSLWEVNPGDGFLNLQLARLARERGSAETAVNYYRASIVGDWGQNGVERRSAVRLELADYLTGRGELQAAETDLLIAAANAPEKDVALQLGIADRLRSLGDLPEALRSYRVAAAQAPRNLQAVAGEGRAEYALGAYPAAARTLENAAELARHNGGDETDAGPLASLAAEARRLPQLSVSRDLPAEERSVHLLVDARIAQRRLGSCAAQLSPKQARKAPMTKSTANAPAASVASRAAMAVIVGALQRGWTAQSRSLDRRALELDAARQDALAQLIDDTETQMAAPAATAWCGAPSEEDALLLLLTVRKQGREQGERP